MTALTKIENMPTEYSKDKVELLKNTVCRGANDDELQLFLHVCKRTGLDPFMKQIYSISRGNQRTIQTGIDGLRLVAERTGRYTPGKESSFVYDEKGLLVSATSYIKKMTHDGTWHDVSATCFSSEYNPGNNPIWKKMPHVMLAKCAEAAALRKACPAEMSGLYTTEEMVQAEVVEVKDEEATLEQIEQFDTILKQKEYDTEKCQKYLDIVSATYKKSKGYIVSKWLQDMDKFEANFSKWSEKNS